MRRLAAVAAALVVVGAGVVLTSPARASAATVVNTGSCVDGGQVTWSSRVTWGEITRTPDGEAHVQVSVAGWTTTRAGTVATDSVVTTSDRAGHVLQTLRRTTAFDYHSGAVFDTDDPVDPPSGPGRTRITVSTGVDGDGHANCTATFVQPNLRAVPVGAVSKVLVVVEENHSLDQMKAGLPYLYSLAQRYAYSDHYTAIRHPSLPNYLAIAGGSTFGVTDDGEPAAHPLNSKTVFGQALDNGRSAGTYAESMPSTCALTGNLSKGYAVKHNPWAYFVNERSACQRDDVPATAFDADAAANRLPDIAVLIPNQCNDAHDCDLATADAWLQDRLPGVLTSSDFTSGALAVVVTADEDDYRGDNAVLTVVLHASLDGSHRVVSTALTHYSLSRLLSQTVGATPLIHAAAAPDLAAAFGLRVGPPPSWRSVRTSAPGWPRPPG